MLCYHGNREMKGCFLEKNEEFITIYKNKRLFKDVTMNEVISILFGIAASVFRQKQFYK